MSEPELVIQNTTAGDADTLYGFALAVPELSARDEMPFMEKYEFLWAIENPQGVFLTAKIDSEYAGFIYGTVDAAGDPEQNRWANLVFIATFLKFRGSGVGAKLYKRFVSEIKGIGATHMYSWAREEDGDVIVGFFEKRGLLKGHQYRWMGGRI